jgi:hypothetical protein
MTDPLREAACPPTAFIQAEGELRPKPFSRHQHVTERPARIELHVATAGDRRLIPRLPQLAHSRSRRPKTIQSP